MDPKVGHHGRHNGLPGDTGTTKHTMEALPWHERSESTSARPTPSSPSLKVANPPSSPTPKAHVRRPRSSHSPSPARSWSARLPSVKQSPTSTARSRSEEHTS